MRLNVKKCVVVTYSRARRPVDYNYCLSNLPLARSDNIRDLGVVLSADLSFSRHIEEIYSKATRILGLIMRSSRCGLSIEALRTLYISLVRSRLEYCSSIWSPHQQCYIDRLESVQCRFLRLIGCRMGYMYRDVPTQDIRRFLGLDTLAKRREISDAMFLFKILNGRINCPDLLALIDLHVSPPRSTRSNVLFARQHCSTNYELYSPLPRLHRLGNRLCHYVDFFDCCPRVVKRIASSVLEEQ
ncbi:uncharacterized protein LOC128984590 [Macrosteles quadrilineatus]|uniref:uncharacterized protein LOC128984590 n=1 Tax=Macrosteles quadrilineatus TaxID=74068 RepID=UPI0023E29F8D|nr:uncharacterized protein LOC128984590 [Macrosteles quadrilineatus]